MSESSQTAGTTTGLNCSVVFSAAESDPRLDRRDSRGSPSH